MPDAFPYLPERLDAIARESHGASPERQRAEENR